MRVRADGKNCRYVARAVVTASVLCCLAAATAGEPAEKPDDTGKAVADDPVFIFDPGDRRDPFTFVKASVIESYTVADPTRGDSGGAGKPVLRPHEVEAKKKEAEAIYFDAEGALGDADAVGALSRCDKGLEVFKDIPNIGEYPQLQSVRENLFRLRKAADRMRQRQEAEREFSRLNIRVTGVVAREKNSQAIINNVIVAKGDVVATAGESSDAVLVEDILPERIVFLFRGYKMTITLSEIGR